MKKIVFDIGAHHGEDSHYYLQRGYNVVAFECDRGNIEVLKLLFHREEQGGMITFDSRAIVSGGGAGKFVTFFKSQNDGWGTVNKDWADRNNLLGVSSSQETVESVDPSDVFKTYGVPYYLKVDIEGVDMDVVLGLFSLNRPGDIPEYISVESTKTSYNSVVKELEIFYSLGYRKFAAVQQRGMAFKSSSWLKSGKKHVYRHRRGSSGPFGSDLKADWLTLS